MKSLLEVCLLALVVTAGITPSRASDSPANLADQAWFSGTWYGTMNDLPSIHLKIQEVGTNISGDVVFYLQKRDDDNRPWQLAGESDRALLAPHVEGKTLTFEVEHDRCHGCPEPVPRVPFRMVLTGRNEARLWNLTDGSDSDSGMKLVRQTENTRSAPAFEQGISVELPVTRNA